MTTILRVKRRNSDEPLDALIVACKKRKVDEAAEVTNPKEPLKTVVKFAGTVQNQEVEAVKEIAKTLTANQLKANYKQHPVDIQNKVRTQTQEDSKENRYKVVNCFREVDSSLNDGIVDDLSMTLIDVEDSVSCTKQNKETDTMSSSDFVFDLYCLMEEPLGDIEDSLSLTIEPFNDGVVFDDVYRDNGDRSDATDSEDSNCEGHWRNEYPDSDDYESENSVGVDDMERIARRMMLNDDDPEYSDEEYENYVEDMDNTKYIVDESDIENFGWAYAKFKASLKQKDEDDDDDDEDDDDYDCDSNYSGVLISEVHSDDEEAGGD